jgi:hypothetical protein
MIRTAIILGVGKMASTEKKAKKKKAEEKKPEEKKA